MDHFYQGIEGWAAFGDLYRIVVRRAKGGETFVEVGSWLGKSAALMGVEIINSDKDIKFFCVDPWTDGGPDLRDTKYYKAQVKGVYESFLFNTRKLQAVLTPLRMTSVEGAQQFEDASVDFIMLDGDHSYEGIRADIDAWLPKMKPGGIMSGDDYLWPGVFKAANETFEDQLRAVIGKRSDNDYRRSVAYWWTQLPL